MATWAQENGQLVAKSLSPNDNLYKKWQEAKSKGGKLLSTGEIVYGELEDKRTAEQLPKDMTVSQYEQWQAKQDAAGGKGWGNDYGGKEAAKIWGDKEQFTGSRDNALSFWDNMLQGGSAADQKAFGQKAAAKQRAIRQSTGGRNVRGTGAGSAAGSALASSMIAGDQIQQERKIQAANTLLPISIEALKTPSHLTLAEKGITANIASAKSALEYAQSNRGGLLSSLFGGLA